MSSNLPTLTWINHASFMYDDGEICVVSDPWLEGNAFDNGWSLLCETKFTYDRFHEVSHIWISHEHPDHFSPLSLEKIPPNLRSKITLLYQQTEDKRVLNFCKKLGFKEYHELSEDNWYSISGLTKIKCIKCRFETNDDSMLIFKTPDISILNLNDCVIPSQNEMDRIKSEVGPIDVLLAQFSYAGWAGNRDQVEYRKSIADKNLDKFIEYAQFFSTKYVIPSASFVRFLNEENSHMNSESVTVATACEALHSRTRCQPVILYPGDSWICGTVWDNRVSLDKYEADYKSALSEQSLWKNKTVEAAQLSLLAQGFLKKLRDNNNPILIFFFPTAYIFIRDIDTAFAFSARRGLIQLKRRPEECDIILGSSGLAYCFKFQWGGDTLNINGRFEKPPGGKFWHFRIYFAASSLNNVGIRFDMPYIFANLKIMYIKLFDYLKG